jgi:hypothetical protein
MLFGKECLTKSALRTIQRRGYTYFSVKTCGGGQTAGRYDASRRITGWTAERQASRRFRESSIMIKSSTIDDWRLPLYSCCMMESSSILSRQRLGYQMSERKLNSRPESIACIAGAVGIDDVNTMR